MVVVELYIEVAMVPCYEVEAVPCYEVEMVPFYEMGAWVLIHYRCGSGRRRCRRGCFFLFSLKEK